MGKCPIDDAKVKHHKKGARGEQMRGTAFGLEVMKPVESVCGEYLVTAIAGNRFFNEWVL